MKLFDGRHLAPALGCFDAVGQQHDAPVDGEELVLEQTQNYSHPNSSELGHIHCLAVEEIQKPVIELRLETQRSHKTGDPAQVTTHAKRCQQGGEPKECAVTREGWTKRLNYFPPMKPGRHKELLLLRPMICSIYMLYRNGMDGKARKRFCWKTADRHPTS